MTGRLCRGRAHSPVHCATVQLRLLGVLFLLGCGARSPATPDAGPPPPNQCTTDADCDAGLCLFLAGCEGPAVRVCLPTQLAPTGPFCGCDGGVTALPSQPWGEPFRCGLDAGPAPTSWHDESWARHYDDAGARLVPRLRALEAPVHLAGPDGGPACTGQRLTLTAPLPDAQGRLHVLAGCGTELAVTRWSASDVELEVPADAPPGCVWLAEGSSEDVAALQARCLDDAGAPPTPACAPAARLHGPPQLSVSAFAGAGLPSELTDGGARVYATGSVLFSWDAGGAPVELLLPRERRALPSAGQLTLEVQGALRWRAEADGCRAERPFVVSPRPALDVSPVVFHEATKGEFQVVLDAPAPARTTVSVKPSALPKGASVPGVAVVEKGQTSVKVELTSPSPLASLGAVRVSAPGYEGTTEALTADARPRGFADLHVHMFANLGFGTTGFYGRPDGPQEVSLRECSAVHGTWGLLDLLNPITKAAAGLPLAYRWPGHHTDGAYNYSGWPDALDYTHQQVHADALKRAWQGGLRLMVLLAVNNQEGCGWAPWQHRLPCDDMSALRRQLDAAHAFAQSEQARGWFRIVTTSAEAREALRLGQLAVVLGAEVDTLGECVADGNVGRHCTAADVDAVLDELQARGVRHVFPVHFLTNGFGGSALYIPLTHLADGDTAEPCPPAGHYSWPNPTFTRCNPRGLSPLGRQLIGKLMARRMIIDVDHQSLRTRTDTLALAQAAGYPVVAGHAWLSTLMNTGHRHEGTLTAQQQDSIYALGGLIGVLTNPADHLDELADTLDARGAPRLPQHCGKSVETLAQVVLEAGRRGLGPVAFGSDLNGFAGQPAGRGTLTDRARACIGGQSPANWVPEPRSLVTYPFRDPQGVTFDRSRFGNRLYDVNTDGFAHVGMYPDLLEALRRLGVTERELDPVMTSADGYVRMWERLDAPQVPRSP